MNFFQFLVYLLLTSPQGVLIYPFQKTRKFILWVLFFLLSLCKICKMEKRSTHWADVLNWLQTVVDSCKTQEQADHCERLLRNFERIYENRIGIRECMDLLRPMRHKLWDISPLAFNEKMKKLQVL